MKKLIKGILIFIVIVSIGVMLDFLKQGDWSTAFAGFIFIILPYCWLIHKLKNPKITTVNIQETPSHLEYITTIKTKVVGVSFKCVFPGLWNGMYMRQDIIEDLFPTDAITLKYFEYKGEPAFYVVNKRGTDIGCLKKELSAKLVKKYPNCIYKVSIANLTGGDAYTAGYDEIKYRKRGCNINIDIYKKSDT